MDSEATPLITMPGNNTTIQVHHGQRRLYKCNTLEERAAPHAVNQEAYYNRNWNKVYHQCRVRFRPKWIHSKGAEETGRCHGWVEEDMPADNESKLQEIHKQLMELTLGQTSSVFLASVFVEAVNKICTDLASHISSILAHFNRLEQMAS
ncbi:hypothetical protein EV421DRAFT_1913399 [Armillaria borealis]|uniref:Uncharacterized protein n=1 Tax=Armillaria borealis TaxID=47425 RepID=A0AA39IUH6_9AGAR|nr:hypothetical protein EV421DRAFT_1913399 [Armillaria borealis]